jgi:2-polyprenyl-3-methyl-5-hydroxy-6-metoxy-1,4-benzoquinol methylase
VAAPYDREAIARAFDEWGDREWSRHEEAPRSRVAFHIHNHYLRRFVTAGDRVLEVGAGAGRFTVELARLGATVTTTDVSRGGERRDQIGGVVRQDEPVVTLGDLGRGPSG